MKMKNLNIEIERTNKQIKNLSTDYCSLISKLNFEIKIWLDADLFK